MSLSVAVVFVHASMYVYLCVYIARYMCACMCACMCVCMYACMYVCMYRKSGNFHVEIIQYSCQFIFVGLWYPRKYFNMNLFQHEHLAITIVHVLLISYMNISL